LKRKRLAERFVDTTTRRKTRLEAEGNQGEKDWKMKTKGQSQTRWNRPPRKAINGRGKV